MATTKKILAVLMFLVIPLTLMSCASLNYSSLSPEAADFHPKTIAVFPAVVGVNEEARGIIEDVALRRMTKKKLFTDIVSQQNVKDLVNSKGREKDLTDYILKLNTLGVSDKDITGKLKDALNVEAFMLINVGTWQHSRQEGNKVGKVAASIMLVDAATGVVMWRAKHEYIDDYWFFKPNLAEVAADLIDDMIATMPH